MNILKRLNKENKKMELNQEYYAEQLEEAIKEKYIYLHALKNCNTFESEHQNDMIIFIVNKLKIIISNIVYYEEKIKDLEDKKQ